MLCDAIVRQLRYAAVVDEDVLGFNIAVVPAARLRVNQSSQYRTADRVIKVVPIERAGGAYPVHQILGDPLQHHEEAVVVGARIQQRDDVLMLRQFRQRGVFAVEAFLPADILSAGPLHPLDCAESAVYRIERLGYGRHPSFPKRIVRDDVTPVDDPHGGLAAWVQNQRRLR